MCSVTSFFFFFQAEDGIRDVAVTGVQTCALPISVPTSAHGWLPVPRPRIARERVAWLWPEGEDDDQSRGSMEGESAVRVLPHAAVAGPGCVHLRHAGLGRVAGRFRRRRRPVAPATRERGRHVLGLSTAV